MQRNNTDTDDLHPYFVTVSRTGFVLQKLRGRILKTNGFMEILDDNGRSILRRFLRVRLENSMGVFTLDLPPATASDLLDIQERLAAKGLSLPDRVVELRVEDDGEQFEVHVLPAADVAEPEPAEERVV